NYVFHSEDTASPLTVHIRETVHKGDNGCFSRWSYRHNTFMGLFDRADPLTINRIDGGMWGDHFRTIRTFDDNAVLRVVDGF
ncbi:MAG: hypothetical protein H7Y60_16865, partial [Rhodospirillaceae bacterium]|nr:hypothetical protein [Rhodospirillales bacterium]